MTGGAGPWDLFADAPAAAPRPGDAIAEILVVCTANICRSPLAMAMLEAQARRRIGADAPVWVRSSGVHGLDGQPAAEQTRIQAQARGLDLGGHRAESTTAEQVAEADLVITMSERQRGLVTALAPAASRWTFTLREVARLCAALKPVGAAGPPRERIRFVARLAHASRAYVARPDGREDVADPYGGPTAGYARMAGEVEALVEAVAPQLFGWLPGEEQATTVGAAARATAARPPQGR